MVLSRAIVWYIVLMYMMYGYWEVRNCNSAGRAKNVHYITGAKAKNVGEGFLPLFTAALKLFVMATLAPRWRGPCFLVFAQTTR